MHSTQYTALARWADNEGAEIVACHYYDQIAGPEQSGACLLLGYDTDDSYGERYAVVNVHLPTPKAARTSGGWTTVAATDGEVTNYIEGRITDLHCGDRSYIRTGHLSAVVAFQAEVRETLTEALGS